MFYEFKQVSDVEVLNIYVQMVDLTENRLDDSVDLDTVRNMIDYMLPRKEEHVYNQINMSNMAEHLVRFIPAGPFVEIKLKADLNDPV